MKVTEQNLQFMKQSIIRLLDYYSDYKNIQVSKNDIENLSTSSKFALWGQVSNNIKFDNNNANVFFTNEKRLFNQNENFDFYIDNTNDKTLETALNEVFKRILKLM